LIVRACEDFTSGSKFSNLAKLASDWFNNVQLVAEFQDRFRLSARDERQVVIELSLYTVFLINTILNPLPTLLQWLINH